jgi:hypothetical protein
LPAAYDWHAGKREQASRAYHSFGYELTIYTIATKSFLEKRITSSYHQNNKFAVRELWHFIANLKLNR